MSIATKFPGGFSTGTTLDARTELGKAMLLGALDPMLVQRLGDDAPYGLVLVVPSPKHVELIVDAFACVANTADLHVLDEPTQWNADRLIESLCAGEVVVAICDDPAQVPASFKALADDTVRVPFHDIQILRKTLASVVGGRIPRFGKDFVVHPDPDLLCRCIAPGLPARKIVDALTKLGELAKAGSGGRVPDLDDAVEFGEAREWGLRVVSDIAAWRNGSLDAADLDNGLLLTSPPGCGKTLFARVLAKALGAEVVQLTLGEMLARDGHLGAAIADMRERFAEATSKSPAVLLLDELDSLGRRASGGRNSLFKTGLINELLVLLDGASERHPGLVVIGATNSPGAIDPAMLRPGRLGRTIALGSPGPDGIENVLRFHLRGALEDEPLDDIVMLNLGKTPAELMDLVRGARQEARAEGRDLAVSDLMSGTVGSGPVDWLMTHRIAVHEAGHALACVLLEDAPALRMVSILPSGNNMGRALTSNLPGVMTRSRVEALVMVALAGRAAESLIFGDDDPSDGAEGDLQNATRSLCRLHGALGMGSSLLHFEEPEERLLHDAGFAALIESELDRLMTAVLDEMRGREVYIREIAMQLCARRTLFAPDLLAIVDAVNDALDAAGVPEEAATAA